MARFKWCSVVLGAFLISVPCMAECPNGPVLFAKIMNAAFAADYEKCTISTTVQFLGTGQTENYVFGAIPKKVMDGKLAFRVLSPGEAEPTGMGSVPPHVFVAKASSDLVFELKRGDAIVLTGHPVMGKMAGMGAGQDFVQVVFVADSLARAAAGADSSKPTP